MFHIMCILCKKHIDLDLDNHIEHLEQNLFVLLFARGMRKISLSIENIIRVIRSLQNRVESRNVRQLKLS